MDKILVSIVGASGMIFIAWFFFGKKEEAVQATGEIDVLVKGGYRPDVIVIHQGRPTKINFLRTDNNSCLEEVVISDFKIRKNLALNEKVTVTITPSQKGEYPFSCGMGMFHGKLIVK